MMNQLVQPVEFNRNNLAVTNRGGDDSSFRAWAAQNHPTWEQDPAEEAIARDEWKRLRGGLVEQQPESPGDSMPNDQQRGRFPIGAILGGIVGSRVGGGGIPNSLAYGALGSVIQKYLQKNPSTAAGGVVPGFLSKLF